MITMDTIRQRHSVREYQDKPIEGNTLKKLETEINSVAKKSKLNIQLVQNNPEVFDNIAGIGSIKGCSNSIVFVTKGGPAQDEAIGYWGQRIVLRAQEIGLNTCWCAFCRRKNSHAKLREGEKIRIIIAVGYGKTQGKKRKTKAISKLGYVEGKNKKTPTWFTYAMEAAQLAPTAMNKQIFTIKLHEDLQTVSATTRVGGWRATDLGIVKRNFEIAANEKSPKWHWE